MGAAVPVALARRRRTPKHLWRHVIRRALVLFGLGLALNALDPSAQFGVSTFRIPGVLQRIAIVYVAVAWLTERTSPRTQAIVATVALLGYWAAMTLIPVPGVGPGMLTPNGNLAAYIDRVLLGRHLVHMTWDSEGLLSTIPAVVTSLIGVMTGRWLMRSPRPHHESVWLFVAGLGLAAIGLLWDRVFPINKNLWTSSFVMLSGGLAVAVLALCHWLLDVRQLASLVDPIRRAGTKRAGGVRAFSGRRQPDDTVGSVSARRVDQMAGLLVRIRLMAGDLLQG